MQETGSKDSMRELVARIGTIGESGVGRIVGQYSAEFNGSCQHVKSQCGACSYTVDSSQRNA
jgi:hypothetical protein